MEIEKYLFEHPFIALLVVSLPTCVTWCCLAHCIFLPYCVCLKRRHKLDKFTLITDKDQPFQILAAHRGGAAERMENTLPAFRNAVNCEMNLLECDVHMSRDGQVVVSHDDTMGRMCGHSYEGKKISDYNYDELPPYQNKVPMHMTEGDYNLRDDEDGRFPLLREMF